VLVGGGVGREQGSGGLLAPLVQPLTALVLSRLSGQRLRPFIAKIQKQDLIVLKELIEAGEITRVIDRTYPLDEVPEAIRHSEAGHARGKVVVTVDLSFPGTL
jgi:NADPH:quinone reductase-like Zn-dependent oxidoreductase